MSETLSIDIDEKTFGGLRDRIAAYSGVYLDASRRRSLSRQLWRRILQKGLDSWPDYISLLDSAAGEGEMNALLEEVVNNETSFFRNPRHFRALAEIVLPEMDRARPPHEPLRLWSAGCSTGQEAYSIAITVAELFGLPLRRPVQILATDISRRALSQAQAGRYTAKQMQRVELPYRSLYFQTQGEESQVKPELRQLVHFQELNLVQTPFPPRFHNVDVIFCRNVTIYFQLETCRRLMANLYRSLNPGGHLFIGFSETLWQIFDAFERIQASGTFFYRKGPASRPLTSRPLQTRPQPHSVPGGSSVERPLLLGESAGTAPPEPAPARPGLPSAPPEHDPAREHYRRGMDKLRQGHYEQALQAFRTALREEPNLVEAYCGLAQAYANQGQNAAAMQACERALELDDLAEEAYLLRGLIHRQLGQTELAIADLERATYLNPGSPTGHFYLGDALLALPDREGALRAFRRTWRTLLGQPEHAIIDGVPVYLLRQACRKYMDSLTDGLSRA
ncbi:MAG: tetratricopeptide repeat protein [Chloroflexia bacterium]|nr:tetratricopeptide repeat protein [Chloroflexia bacterium]